LSSAERRRTCEQCKAVFHVTERPSKAAHRAPAAADGSISAKTTAESITVRLEAYDAALAADPVYRILEC